MKRLLLLKSLFLLCALVVGSSAWADTSTVTASRIASSSASWTGSASETWSVAVVDGAIDQNVTNGYAQVGTKKSPSTSITFSTSGISGTITNIVVDCASYSGLGTISATVGGSAFGTQSQSIPSWSSNTGGDITFSGSGSGAIVITMTNGSGGRAMYIKSITVTYTPSGGGSDPSISADDVNIAQDATNGSIAYTLNNATGNVSASLTTGDWLILDTEHITASAVPFTCSANTGAERTATVTLSFTGATDKVVTITQAAKTVEKPTFNLDGGSYMQGTNITISSEGNSIYYNLTTDGSTPAPPTNASTEYTAPIALGSGTTKITAIAYDTYGNVSGTTTRTYTGIALASLPFSWTGTKTAAKDELAAETGVAVSLGSNYADSNAPYRLKFDGVGKNVTIYTDGKPENVYFTAKLFNAASTGSKIKVQGSADGITFTDIEEFTIKGSANATFEFATSNAFAATHRVVKLTMSSKDQNVGVGTICVSCIPLTPAKTYTTLTHKYALDFTSVSSYLKAYIATEVSGGAVQMTQVNKVPANTGLVLKATNLGNAVEVPVFDGTSPDDVSGNKMAGSATETTAVAANAGYILSGGVFQPSSGGDLPAGKAYLNIGVGAGARALEMNFDDNETTGLSEVTNTNLTNNTNEFFDLQGRKVAQPTKGLYIVNGKKVVVK